MSKFLPLILLLSVLPVEVQGAPLTPTLLCSKKLQPTDAVHPRLIVRHSVHKDPDFLVLVAAVITVESNWDPEAISSAAARGLMQMTEIAALDASIACGLPILDNQDKLFTPSTNIKYGTCYLKSLLKITNGDVDAALVLYNSGYRGYQKYLNGGQIPDETAHYIVKVRRALGQCRSL